MTPFLSILKLPGRQRVYPPAFLPFTEKVLERGKCVSSASAPRIFVVDDEHVIASTLAVILNMNGFSARFFTRPLEALAAAHADTPDLLISDVAMPELSGVDLAIAMKTQHPACKVLLFSGQAASVDLLEDARKQGHDFQLLLKPVHPTKLLSEIRTGCWESRGKPDPSSVSA